MLLPKRVKYRRQHRGRMKGAAHKGNYVAYGDFGLQALEPSWITSNQIEAARIAMTHYIKRGGQVWIKIFPHKPITEKPALTTSPFLTIPPGAAFLTEATTTSPMFAYLRLEPPRTRMHMSSLAPVLSATFR